MTLNCRAKKSGFTLVELLVVIAILSILAGAVFMIINPAELQRKAKETTLKAGMAKVCTAFFACASVKSAPTECDSYSEIGAIRPTDPVGASFPDPALSGQKVTISGSYPASSPQCIYSCSFDFSDGTITNLTGAGCL